MKRVEFAQRYPSLAFAIAELSADNNMTMRKEYDLNGLDLDNLEQQADSLPRKALQALCCDDEEIQKRIIFVYSCEDLHAFLNSAFDGAHTERFFQ